MRQVVIETTRFTLRSLTKNDATERYSRWFDDPAAAEHIVAARAPHDVESLRRYIAEKSASPNVLFLGIFVRDSGVHIGNLKFEPIEVQSGSAVVGVLIGDPAWRNKGVFREVFPAVAQQLSTELGLRSFWLGVASDNHAAIAAYCKAGFDAQHPPPPELYPTVRRGAIYMQYRSSR